MRKTRHRRKSRRRRSRKMRGGMFGGIGNMFAKAGNALGLTRPQGDDKKEDPNRPKSPVTETPAFSQPK